MADGATLTVETAADFGEGPGADVQRWISELDLAAKDHRPWLDVSRRIIKRYRDDQNEASTDVKQRRFALLWSNIETLEPAVFARTPVAVVSRRWKDADQVGRLASEVLERSLNFQLDACDFADVMEGMTKDYLLIARGVDWVRYVPHMKTVDPAGGQQQAAEDGQIAEGQEPYEVVDWEEVIPDHVSYDDFLHNPARKWAEVRWVSRRAYMTRDELVTRFGEELGKAVPLDHGDHDGDSASDATREQFDKAEVYEIWDKPSRKVIWVSKSYTDQVLDERDDPLGLKDFFPCPRPALGTCAPDSLIPVPDYNYYRSQDQDINTLTVRIGLLQDALKVRGFYAAGSDSKNSLADLLTTETNTMIPVDSWAAFQDKGGVQGMVAWLPLDIIVATLKGCIEARQQLVQDVYQVTGIADIMRGDVDPDETATATRTKATWGSSRVRKKQKTLARVARETIAIMGQIVASKFDARTLAGMSNVQLLPDQAAKQQLQAQVAAQAQQWQAAAAHAQANGQPPPPQPQIPPQMQQLLASPTWRDVTALLRDNVLRSFRLDIETDSTIEPNDQDEKERRIEFIEAVGDYVSKSVPAIQLMPQMLPVIAQGLLFLIRGFRVGREMEDVIEKALEQLQSAQAQPKPQAPAGPDPPVEQMKGQAAVLGAQAKVADAQTNQFRAQTDRYEAQAGAQIEAQRLGVEQQQQHLDRQADLSMHGQDIAADMQQAVIKGVERRFIHEMNAPQPIRAPTP